MSAAKDAVFLNIADQLGELSTCDRASIGAVITRAGRCVSWGYNGAPPGLPHCEGVYHGWIDEYPDWPDAGATTKEMEDAAPNAEEWCNIQIAKHGCRNATHAEANALAYAARQGISTDPGTLYVSVAPCLNCSRLLIAAGIVRVVYGKLYRDESGLELLRAARVECEQL